MAELTELNHYSPLQDDWQVKGGVFVSPLVGTHPGQILVFGEQLRNGNGSISADITILNSHRMMSRNLAMEAGLLVRYNGRDQYYYAGTGAFDNKFFIGKALPGPQWHVCQWAGESRSVLKNKPYRLRLDCNGSKITLYENDVEQLVLSDASYQSGQCGLLAWSTQARFENVRLETARPKAFLIMPFKSQLDFVHRVIGQTVQSYGIDCVRADQIAVSQPVMDDVKAQIAEADLVIVDFTGKNPNVYYEAGLADAWKKNWIVLAQSPDDMTFDVQHIRSIRYTNTMGADKELEEALSNALKALGYVKADKQE